MTATIYPQTKALSLNPIILHIEDDSEGYVPFSVLVPVSITPQGAAQLDYIYSGQVYLSEATGMAADVNLSDVIRTLFDGQVVPHTQESILASQSSLSRHVYFWVGAADDEDTVQLDIEVYHGGISRQLFRTLRLDHTDIFQKRFLNYNGNFFFSAVDTSWQVVRHETEIMPLFFIMPDGGVTITPLIPQTAALETQPSWDSGADLAGQLVSVDIQALRRHFFNSCGLLASLFNVTVNGNLATRIAIEQAWPSKNTVTARFLSSLGTWEKMVLYSNPQIQVGIGSDIDDADDTYKVFDTLSQDFVDSHPRREAVSTIHATTDIILPRQRQALLELLQSDSVYVTIEGTQEQPTLVTMEDIVWQHRQEKPERFGIVFSPIRPGVIPWNHERPRVFSPQFSPQFM